MTRVIKRMLTEPRMPAIAPMDAITAMIEASAASTSTGKSGQWRDIYNALRAHLAKPTREVDVWRVEYAEASPDGYIPSCETHDTAAEAESAARNFHLSAPAYECIRVTGPHKQTVPAT